MTSRGVPFGATMPRFSANAMSTPSFFRVGTSGRKGERAASAMAKPLSSPCSMYLRPEATLSEPRSMAPDNSTVMRSRVPS